MTFLYRNVLLSFSLMLCSIIANAIDLSHQQPDTSIPDLDTLEKLGAKDQTINQKEAKHDFFCPKVNTLILKNELWYGGDAWKSYSKSFAKSLGRFSVAQWQGVNIGPVICIYESTEKYVFPVQVSSLVLVKLPTGGRWADMPGGRKVCVSNDVNDCPMHLAPVDKAPSSVKQILDDIHKTKELLNMSDE